MQGLKMREIRSFWCRQVSDSGNVQCIQWKWPWGVATSYLTLSHASSDQREQPFMPLSDLLDSITIQSYFLQFAVFCEKGVYLCKLSDTWLSSNEQASFDQTYQTPQDNPMLAWRAFTSFLLAVLLPLLCLLHIFREMKLTSRVGLTAPSMWSKFVPLVFMLPLVYYLRKHLSLSILDWFWGVCNFFWLTM